MLILLKHLQYPGNYTAITFSTALSAVLANGANSFFFGIMVTYSDRTYKFTFTCPHVYTLSLSANCVMNTYVGFPSGIIHLLINSCRDNN